MFSRINVQYRFLFSGILFGMIFPIIATFMETRRNYLDQSIYSWIQIQLQDPLLWIIDSAPIFLGFFAWLAGVRQGKIEIAVRELTQALDLSGEYLRALIRNFNYAIIVTNDNGKITGFNQSAETLTGYPEREILEKDFQLSWFFVHPPRETKGVENFSSRLVGSLTGNNIENEYSWKIKNNNKIEVGFSLLFKGAESSGNDFFVWMVRDISKKKTEEEIRKQEERKLLQVLDLLPVAVFMMNSKGIPTYANEKALEILGKGIIPGMKIDELAEVYNAVLQGSAEPYPIDKMPIVRALRGEFSYIDDMVIDRGRDQVTLEVIGGPVRDQEGNIESAVAVFMDITERMRIQKELNEREQRFKAVFESANVGIILCSSTLIIRDCNHAFAFMLGEEPLKLRSKHLHDFIHPQSASKVTEVLDEFKSGIRNSITLAENFLNKEGKIIYGEIFFSVISNEMGEPDSILIVVKDITQRVLALRAQNVYMENLEEANKTLDRFSGNLKDLHQVLTAHYESPLDLIEKILEMGTRVFGLKFGTLGRVEENQLHVLATSFRTAEYYPGLRVPLNRTYSVFVAEKKETIAWAHVGSNPSMISNPLYLAHKVESFFATPVIVGNSFYAVLSFSSLEKKDKEFSSHEYEFLELLSNAISRELEVFESRKALEKALQDLSRSHAELVRSNKELDDFAYIVSHDLKAPLRGISTLSDWIKEGLAEKNLSTIEENISLLQTRANRMAQLINAILEFSRLNRKPPEKQEIDLNHLLIEIKDLLNIPKNFQVIIPENLPVIKTDKFRITQVFLNLLSNAVKYSSKESGRVEIICQRKKDEFWFEVKDNGAGIDPRFHEKIFGIFQRLESRDNMEGTGIGLAIVKKIVEESGGRVWVESRMGEGSGFFFTWPQ